VENRKWATNHRGLLYIHAAATPDRIGDGRIWWMAGPEPAYGAIIGSVMLMDCVYNEARSRWAEDDMWHWILARRRPLEKPLYCSGQQSLWSVPENLWPQLDQEGKDWLQRQQRRPGR
jgi:hypothetical protein